MRRSSLEKGATPVLSMHPSRKFLKKILDFLEMADIILLTLT